MLTPLVDKTQILFTGIIEALGTVKALRQEGSNVHFTIQSPFTNELQVDQSVAHNGVCLTVTQLLDDCYEVTAISETLEKSNLGNLAIGNKVNLERCVKVGDRLDGHIVQGHVDMVAECINIKDENGSWLFEFSFGNSTNQLTVPKGSICVNGISLTVVDSDNVNGTFSVAIIPYTYEHTNFKELRSGDTVNLEFDIVGKYVTAQLAGK